MGKVTVKVKLENVVDVALAERGIIDAREVRRCEVDALADSGASFMCLPEEIVAQLGLEVFGTETARLATGERHEVPLARTLRIRIGERVADQDCMVLPPGTQPLVGQWVLQEMDLVVDSRRERLVPGHSDADGPVYDLLAHAG